MISKERLQELIEQEETVWCASELWGGNKLKLHNKDVSDSDCFHISKTLLLSDSIEFYDEEETYRVPFQLLFETQEEYLNHKEEAEWVFKMHASRLERFEPPLWEEMIKEPRCLDCWTKEFIVMDNDKPIGKAFIGVDFDCEIVSVEMGSDQYFVERLTKDNYIKACTIARKLFLGESVEKGENNEESKN